METNKEKFYKYAESLGIKINDAQRLMMLAKEVDIKEIPTVYQFCQTHSLVDLPANSKEVEVLDIDEVSESWRKTRTHLMFISYLKEKGYKLIKIKEN